ncbi:MAG: Crp/Fnr family transcriptional regulator [Flavobacteriales bacterium]|nr:Crp/Fnr family transcriptional regulator [Flavobacteriales bacterium]
MTEVSTLFEEFEEKYPSAITEMSLNRGDFLIRKGQVERYTYFILSGAVAVKLFKESESHTIRFGYQGSFLNSIPSFFDNSPSYFDIVALRKTKVKAFAKKSLYELIESNESYKVVYISVLENLITHFVEREIDLLASSPAKRYERVLERSPQLFNEVPLKYIADYLRMSPETLSRLRKS